MKHAIVVVVDEPAWRSRRGLVKKIEHAARVAIDKGARRKHRRGLTVLLSSDAKLKELNRAFRNKNQPTNVLAFPAATNDENYVGDVAIALGVVEREAEEQRKAFSQHAIHLAVHGVLHLLGYDHESAADAKGMERLETKILSSLGIPDPYEFPPKRP